MIKVNLFKEGVEIPEKISETYFKKIVKKTAVECGIDKISVTLVFCGNNYIKDINRRFRKKNYPTDVLSFPDTGESFPLEKKMYQNSGEIYISVDKAIEQADEFGIKVRDELKRLIIHGFLHLIGYDHEKSKTEEKKMFKKEEEILNTFNG
jgi:probable rRNA maturation factor